jgi:hypothetical protein
MSDTNQVVRWTLEMTCALRSPESSSDPAKSLAEVAKAMAVGAPAPDDEGKFGVFGDVYVSSCRYMSIPEDPPQGICQERPSLLRRVLRLERKRADLRKHLDVAHGGFLISRQFAHVGGLDGLRLLCADCPANTLSPNPGGCAGFIFQEPEDPELEAELKEIIARLGLDDRLAEFFIRTTPIWYGLWARSPLTEGAMDLLDQVLRRVARERAERGFSNSWEAANVARLKAFVRATRLSRIHGLALRVSMAPPGHADFGDCVIHAHCPRCKAFAKGVPRWQPKYPPTPCQCHVCGMTFDAAGTVSRSESKYEDDSLRELLGPEGFYGFQRSYLAARGFGSKEIAQVIARIEEEQREDEARAERSLRLREKQEKFIGRVLYAGLHPIRLNNADPADVDWFRADELREVIRRGKRCKAKFQVLAHHSVREELRLKEWAMTRGVEKLLREWEVRGCNEWFSMILSIPDDQLAELGDEPARF